MRNILFAAIAVGTLIAAGAATAETLHYTAALKGASETPPNTTAGTGKAEVDLDTATKTATWTVDYSGLSGPATAAHFHGPAAAGKAAGVEVPITGDLTSPIKGSAPLTDAQEHDLRGGLWYVNVHTAAHPDGEIRGQVVKGH
jgi:hypothetical protein